MHWLTSVYREVHHWREILGIRGLATQRDTLELIEAVPGLTLERVPPGVPAHMIIDHTAGDPAGVIFLPPDLADGEAQHVVLHEAAHFLFRGLLIDGMPLRAYRREDARAEAPARAFATMWRLAGLGLDADEHLAAAAGCSLEEVSHYRTLLLNLG